jgi:hypothetical protein
MDLGTPQKENKGTNRITPQTDVFIGASNMPVSNPDVFIDGSTGGF